MMGACKIAVKMSDAWPDSIAGRKSWPVRRCVHDIRGSGPWCSEPTSG